MKWMLLGALVSTGAMAAPLEMAEFKAHDRNGDGFVDRVEVMGSVELQGQFQNIDTDADGRISAAEMQAWIDNPNKPSMLQARPIDLDQQRRDVARERAAREEEANRVSRQTSSPAAALPGSGSTPSAQPANEPQAMTSPAAATLQPVVSVRPGKP